MPGRQDLNSGTAGAASATEGREKGSEPTSQQVKEAEKGHGVREERLMRKSEAARLGGG